MNLNDSEQVNAHVKSILNVCLRASGQIRERMEYLKRLSADIKAHYEVDEEAAALMQQLSLSLAEANKLDKAARKLYLDNAGSAGEQPATV